MTKRLTCSTCYRPIKVCYCHAVTKINNALPVIIIQHPQETNHPFNTGNMVAQSLLNCQLIQAETLSHSQVNLIINESSALLYPSMAWLPETQTVTSVSDLKQLVVIDANWRKSKKMLFLNPILQQLPRVALDENLRSEYAIRKSSIDGALSTIESVYHALSSFDTNVDFQPLLNPFHWMIQQHKNLM